MSMQSNAFIFLNEWSIHFIIRASPCTCLLVWRLRFHIYSHDAPTRMMKRAHCEVVTP